MNDSPPAELTDHEIVRYRRNIDVAGIGTQGQRRLRDAAVLVVGAGGLGSPVLLYLAAAGVGTIGIVDGDVVEVSNLQRQMIHPQAAQGQNKATSAAERLALLNSEVVTRPYPRMLTDADAPLLAEYDVVVDCVDTFAAKLLISDLARCAGVPLVWGAITGMTGQASVFGVPGPGGGRLWLRDLFPAEPPAGTYPLAAQVGVLGAAVGQIGSVLATETIKLITGAGRPLAGRVLIADTAAGRWDVVAIHPAGAGE